MSNLHSSDITELTQEPNNIDIDCGNDVERIVDVPDKVSLSDFYLWN